jgi:GNAT superfamily N-acetyltransferase
VSTPSVSQALAQDRSRVVETVVAAFAGDPAFRHFFSDDLTYGASASKFAGWLFDKRVGHGTVWLVDGGNAVAMWDPPRGTDSAPGAPDVPDGPDLPPDALARLRAYDSAVHPLLPRTPFWYLGVVATHPDHAGQKLGRLAMQPGLDRARNAGLPAYLETTTARNVEVYRSVGWEIADTISVDGVDVRVMRHS